VIGVRSRIGENVTIRDTYIMGIDFPEHSNQFAENQKLNRPPFGVGANSVIERAIIDKNARIGRNVRVINERRIIDSEEQLTHVIRDGIVVIPKATELTDGSQI
jgi:glucose-1-phosphate adenylyltransferase